MMNRRGFAGAALAGLGGLIFSQKLEGSDSSKDIIWIIRVGDDDNPATTEDIASVMKYVEEHKEIPRDGELIVDELKINRSPNPGVLIIRIGSNDRPASWDDFEDIRNQLDKVYNDPDLTIITHHSFNAEWIPTQANPGVPYILASHIAAGESDED